jgi:cytochrome d ubiquinol oxidase subunit II
MDHATLATIWFVLQGALLTGYALLDGFDLGVGILHPFVPRGERERRIAMNAIGPIWDGNEVWLVTFGGALFAAFPEAYATVFSGFYTAFVALLFALILRAVSLEFRSKMESQAWRRFWDHAFFAGSALAALLFGVAVGNAMLGVPLDARGDFTGTFADLLHPYALLVGVFVLATFAMHGALFLNLKTEGELQARLETWMWRTFGVFLVTYLLTTIYTLVLVPRAAAKFAAFPVLAPAAVIVAVLAVANIPRSLYWRRPAHAFASSCVAIAALLALFGAALFPNLVTAANDPALSITIHNAASSERTLRIMLLFAAVGLPFVAGYTAVIYWTFRGKVRLDAHSY